MLSPLNTVVNDFAFVKAQGWKKDKPTTLNTLTTVGVRNGNIFYLAALMPISPKFRHPPMIITLSAICFFCWHKFGKENKPTILNPMTTVEVPYSILQHLPYLYPMFAIPPPLNIGVNDFV